MYLSSEETTAPFFLFFSPDVTSHNPHYKRVSPPTLTTQEVEQLAFPKDGGLGVEYKLRCMPYTNWYYGKTENNTEQRVSLGMTDEILL